MKSIYYNTKPIYSSYNFKNEIIIYLLNENNIIMESEEEKEYKCWKNELHNALKVLGKNLEKKYDNIYSNFSKIKEKSNKQKR